MFSNFWATRLAPYVSAILLSITLLCQPGVREVAGEVLLSAVPAAQASNEPTASWVARCALIMAQVTWVSTLLSIAQMDLLSCDAAPWDAECSTEEREAIEATIAYYQSQLDTLWDRARAMHCVD